MPTTLNAREAEDDSYNGGEGNKSDRMDFREELLACKNDDSEYDGLPQEEVGNIMTCRKLVQIDQRDFCDIEAGCSDHSD